MSYPQNQGWQQPAYPPPPAGYQPGYQQGYQPAPNQWPQAGYAAPAAAPPQQQYMPPPQPYVAQPQPMAQAQHVAQPGESQCRLCGCVPAVKTTFRGHQGILVVMRFLHLAGPFCRDCGMATYRRMTADTLVQGWWGYASFVITPITVLVNLTRRGKVANLPAPMPPADGRHGRPLDPGKPLYARPQAWIGLCLPFVLIFVFILYVVLNATSQ